MSTDRLVNVTVLPATEAERKLLLLGTLVFNGVVLEAWDAGTVVAWRIETWQQQGDADDLPLRCARFPIGSNVSEAPGEEWQYVTYETKTELVGDLESYGADMTGAKK